MKLNKKILGTPVGRINDIVFADWNGITVGRTYQPEVANPQTEAQTTNRNRFKLINQMAVAFATATMIGLRRAFNGMTYRNAFVKINSQSSCLQQNGQMWEFSDPSAVSISRGSLTSPQDVTLTYVASNNSVKLDWIDSGRNGNDRSDDKICIVAMVKTGLDAVTTIVRDASRDDLTASILLAETPTSGQIVNVWYFFNNRQGTNCSPNGFVSITV